MSALTREKKITFGKMRASGDRWPDDVRLSQSGAAVYLLGLWPEGAARHRPWQAAPDLTAWGFSDPTRLLTERATNRDSLRDIKPQCHRERKFVFNLECKF
jgi:hypothetical protein